MSQKFS